MWRGWTAPLAALLVLSVLAAACGESTPRDAAPAPTPTAGAVDATPSATIPAPTATLLPASPTPGAPPAATAVPPSTRTPAPPEPTAPAPASTPTGSATPVRTPSPPLPGVTATPSPSATPIVAHVTAAAGVPVRLAQGVVADLPGGRTLALVAVTADSRCPANVQCVWAGEANLLFEWGVRGALTRVPLVTSPGRGSASLPGGFVLRALELQPTPLSGTPIPLSDYAVTVVIEPDAVATSGAYGSVTVGPSCPVQREGVPCPDRPLAATLLFRNTAGVEVARALSDATGFYSVALAPGRYTIVPFTPGGATLPRGIPRDVEVAAREWVVAHVSYDSGIR